ncbi:metallophosphoesterase [Bacteroides sp. 224]|uniref:metallophosphoesterase n=1 Tax=Bacteroides sp. 224 TaxID=2302936 RepID=UPI0013D18F32|nr:metallophosphoesterase [Bacteroides sp. 224]NDV65645.1 metallophosphoesterase [Bacteroides sp. 224]
MSKIICWLLGVLCLFTSCASLNFSNPGIGRVKKYTFEHKDIPSSFDGYRIVFISDLHYKSLFNKKRLTRLVKTIEKQHPDILLMGGDYHEGCEYVPELFTTLSRIDVEDGKIAVLGNHDYAACYQEIVKTMQENEIRLLEHELDTISRAGEQIIIAGVRDPFNLKENGRSPSLDVSDDDFVILLVHTPDYIENVPVTHTDLALSGHTHGGQVTFFGLYAPALRSRYGQRFRTGLKYNSEGIPVIITNGVGTSRKKIRAFAPSEVVVVKLKRNKSL